MSVRVLKQLTVEKVETPHEAFRPETLFTADVQNNVWKTTACHSYVMESEEEIFYTSELDVCVVTVQNTVMWCGLEAVTSIHQRMPAGEDINM